MRWVTFFTILVFWGLFILDLWAKPTPFRRTTWPCDLDTLTFNLGAHGSCRWYRSSCFICVPSLKFVGLPGLKICHTFFSTLIRMVTLTFELLTWKLKLMRFIVHYPICIWFSYLFNQRLSTQERVHYSRGHSIAFNNFFLICILLNINNVT